MPSCLNTSRVILRRISQDYPGVLRIHTLWPPLLPFATFPPCHLVTGVPPQAHHPHLCPCLSICGKNTGEGGQSRRPTCFSNQQCYIGHLPCTRTDQGTQSRVYSVNRAGRIFFLIAFTTEEGANYLCPCTFW